MPKVGYEDPHALIREVASALRQGRTPRAGRYLQSAARELTANADVEGAAQALRLVALLELRRGKPQQALRPARAADRLVRNNGISAECAANLDLLSRLYSCLGEHAQAIRTAERWTGEAIDPTSRATRRLSLAKWAAGDASGAIELLDPLEDEAGSKLEPKGGHLILQTEMLLWVGCPTAALSSLTRLLKTTLPAAEECDGYRVRGWAALALGQPDQALRSFRRATRLAAELADPRKEAEIEVALATGELERAKRKGTDLTRAEARLLRKRAQAGRLGLSHLADPVDPPAITSALGAATVKEAAQRLVAMTRASDSLTLVDACCLEVERLGGLPSGDPPYGFSQVPPLSLE